MFALSRKFGVTYVKNAAIAKRICLQSNKAFFSAQSSSTQLPVSEEVLMYEGKYSSKMKWLRKLSLTSAILGTVFLPISFVLESGIIPIIAQAGVMGILCVFSASSTAILQVVGHPYVGSIYELLPPLPADDKSNGKPIRRFKASKYNVLGKPKFTEFVLSDVTKQTVSPFASCRIEKAKGDFYVFGGPGLRDEDLRDYMTREGREFIEDSSSVTATTTEPVVVESGGVTTVTTTIEGSELDAWKERRNKKQQV